MGAESLSMISMGKTSAVSPFTHSSKRREEKRDRKSNKSLRAELESNKRMRKGIMEINN